MRVFSAVDIGSESLLDELERVRDRLDLGFNTVSQAKMHITLQFFEDIDREQLEEVKDAMGSVSTQPFDAEIRGIGAFPSHDYIRVVWAGAEQEKLRELYSEVSRHEVPEDSDHEFRPHVTLARVENVSPGRKKKLQKSLEEFGDHRFGTLYVDSVKLYRSQLTGDGSSYQELQEEEL